ncbi:hypothetical protein ACF073_24840 [Streptomyces sp. NPDC015171]|uniref:hypothetical protein n=1 Tax=Streptomyces sp. NPDC015171 TaxID=3364945 RepID=UPI0036F76F62
MTVVAVLEAADPVVATVDTVRVVDTVHVTVNFRRARTLARKPGPRRSPRGERRRDTVAFLFPT